MLPMYQRIGQAAFKKDLSNTLRMCEALGNPHQKFRSVHVAGTNGKGSSSHALAACLQAAGYKTGLYTSPHLKNFSERIRLNGEEISRQEIVDWVARHQPLIEEVKPSFFELTVVMAFDFFARHKVDIVIVEVGMGGRLDSTNVITPEVCLITRIGLDHMAFLGNTLAEIAGEKAGIIKTSVPVVISEQQAETTAVFQQKAAQCKAPLHFAADHISLQALPDGSWQVWLNGACWVQAVKPQVEAKYFVNNLPGVLYTLHELQMRGFQKITPESVREGLSQMIRLTGLKGRWQVLRKKPLLVCDVSHNPDGMQQLMEQLRAQHYEKLFLIIGTVNDKDVNTVLALLPKAAFYYFCQANIPRALAAGELQKLAASHGLQGELGADVNQAISKALAQASEKDLILITGSTFVVAEIEDL
jgi:dihydrofolate synthase/folylpolyglutamate synthase